MNIDFWLRFLTILAFVTLRLYWYIEKNKALATKQKSPNKLIFLEKTALLIAALFVTVNLFGFTILRFENTTVQLLGFVLVIIGITEAMAGRYLLGRNWMMAYEYQIKKEHNLITNGIYKYVRHPIYSGLMIGVTGALLVAKTYLVIPIFFIQIIIITYFARREEILLTGHFGPQYVEYMKRTKMFIPIIY